MVEIVHVIVQLAAEMGEPRIIRTGNDRSNSRYWIVQKNDRHIPQLFMAGGVP
jgi:hypothetical protein